MSSKNTDDIRCSTSPGNMSTGGKNEKKTVILEEQPTMRSVGLMAPPSSIGLQDPFGGSIGIQRPAPGFGAPPSLKITKPKSSLKGDLRYSGKGAGSVTKEWTAKIAVPAEWNVDKLEVVPDDFPLERTSKEITGADGSEIAKRISDALRDMSVQAKYDGKGAKAKCRTTDYVSFRIRLFSACDSGKPVVVEVQRRSGSCSSFMRVYRAILCAAEGESDVTVFEKKSTPSMKKPVGNMECLKQVANAKADHASDAKDGLDCSINLLKTDEKESMVLGLENLCHLTDPSKTNPIVSLHVSKSVIIGDQSNNVREIVALYLKKSTFEQDDDEEEAVDLDGQLHSLALNAFSNALAVTSKDGCLLNAVKVQEWYTEFLIPMLLQNVRNFEFSSNDAHTASCCLKNLMKSSSVALECVLDLEGDKAFDDAVEFGTRLHESLASEAKQCMDILRR